MYLQVKEEIKKRVTLEKQLDDAQLEVKILKRNLEEYKELEEKEKLKESISKIIKEEQLPETLITDIFMATLTTVKEEEQIRTLVKDRKNILTCQENNSTKINFDPKKTNEIDALEIAIKESLND